MDIQKVQFFNGGYKVNDQFFIPEDPENEDYKSIQDWVADGNVILEGAGKSIEILKAEKKLEINKQRDLNMTDNISYTLNGEEHSFQRDIMSNLAWINNIETMDGIAVSSWITADNAIVDLTKADLIAICNIIRERDTEEVIQARKRKDAVYALTTVEEVENYDINTVYPI